MTAIADVLIDAGYEVYLPHRDGMEFRLVHEVLIDRGWAPALAGQFLHEAIFAMDVFQLVADCQAVVWNMNGRVPDEGAVSEAAIAWTLGKPLISYCDDVRSLIAGRKNPLLAGLVEFRWAASIGEIVPLLREEIQRCGPQLASAQTLPARVRQAVAAGSVLWTSLKAQSACCDNGRLADCVTELFAPPEENPKHEIRNPKEIQMPKS
jgi:hypothetical protein